MLSSSRFMYLFSISHSICSLIIFFDGRNMFFKISTSSVCSAAFVMRLRIFMIFTIASCSERTNEARLYTFCHFPSYFVVAESNVIVQYKRALCYRRTQDTRGHYDIEQGEVQERQDCSVFYMSTAQGHVTIT